MILLSAINKHQTLALALASAAGVTGILAVALVPAMGIKGAALAALLGDLCISAWLVPSIASRQIADNSARFLIESSASLMLIDFTQCHQ